MWNFVKESNGYKKIVIDFMVQWTDLSARQIGEKTRGVQYICASFSSGRTFVALSRAKADSIIIFDQVDYSRVQKSGGNRVEVSNVPEQIIGVPVGAPRHIVPARTQ